MIRKDSFSQSWYFLQQEAYLFASCIGNGLTSIRRAPSKGKGEWYNAFFQLSIGLERLMKSIIIVDHINQSKPLSELSLKYYRHDLLKLYDGVGKLTIATEPNPASQLPRNSTAYQIIKFLTDFAKRARYHNLNELTSSSSGTDPLAAWNKILSQIVSDDIPQQRRSRILSQFASNASAIEPLVMTIHHDLDNNLSTLQEYIQSPRLEDEAAGYAVCHLFEVLRPLETCLSDVTHVSYKLPRAPASVPQMWEHISFLRETKRCAIRNKRCWP